MSSRVPEQKKPWHDVDPLLPTGFKGGLLPERCKEAMKGPHPKPGEWELNRIREFQEKATQYEKELLAAERTAKEADRECQDLAQIHMERLKKEDPDKDTFRSMN
jgi:hypothetical protein